jgi:chromosome partitioning protein
VIIPTQADIFSLQGIGQLYQTVQAVKKYCNPQIYVAGILLTRYRARAVLTRDMTALLEETAMQLQTKLYQTRIRECIAIKEAQAKRTDIFSYSAKSNASEDYWNFIEEVLHDGEENV